MMGTTTRGDERETSNARVVLPPNSGRSRRYAHLPQPCWRKCMNASHAQPMLNVIENQYLNSVSHYGCKLNAYYNYMQVSSELLIIWFIRVIDQGMFSSTAPRCYTLTYASLPRSRCTGLDSINRRFSSKWILLFHDKLLTKTTCFFRYIYKEGIQSL